MRTLWQIFLIVSMGASIATAGTVSCRDRKPEMTQCDPYSGTFFKIVSLKRRIESLRNRPITTRGIPITQKIKVKNGMTLDSLISKYIKREERLYKRSEQKRRKRKMERKISLPDRESKKISKHNKEKQIASSMDQKNQKKTQKKDLKISVPKVDEPRKLLIEKKPEIQRPTQGKKVIQTKVVEVPKPIILTPTEEPDNNISSDTEESNILKEKNLEEEAILPAELMPDQNQTDTEIKQSIKEEFAIYVVQKGDSLEGVAKKFGVDINNLVEINHLKRKNTLKVGQKLRIPLQQGDADAIATATYVVKRGDTLSRIAKHFHVKLKDIIKYNRIKKRSIIHIGQKLVLPLPHKLLELKRIEEKKRKERLKKKRERERLARSALKKRQKAKFLREAKGLKRRLSVTATAYTSHRGQTDKTPFLAAWNNRIRPGMKIIAVSRDLITRYGITNGSRVRISGLKGIYTVRDKMNKKWRKKIDIYMGTSRWRALRWGKKRVTLYY